MLKGLIIKDWYIVRTQLILSLCIYMLPNLLLIGYSLSYDPSQDTSGGMFPTLVGGFISVLSILGCSSFMINTINEDVTSGWIKYSLTSPVWERKICLAKILNCVILVFGLAGISLLFNLLAAVRCGNMEVMIAAPICTAFLQVSVLAPVFPLAIRFGPRKATGFYIGFLLIAVICILLAASMLQNAFYAMQLRYIFYGGIPLMTVISVGLSVKFGKNLRRGI